MEKQTNASRSRTGTIAFLVIAASLLCWFGFGQATTRVGLSSTESAERQESPSEPSQRRFVSALGRLEPEGTVLKLAPASGNEGACIESLLVLEGQDVVPGQVLAVLDSYSRRKNALEETKANERMASAKLSQVEAGAKLGDIEAAKASVALAQELFEISRRELDRTHQLYRTRSVSDEEMEARRSVHQRASHELSRSTAQLTSVQEIRSVDIQAQAAAVALAHASVKTATANLEATQVCAPIAGRILRVRTWPGEKPTDQGIVELGAVQKMQAVAEVYEGDLLRLKVGQPTTIQLDSDPQLIQGRVHAIGNMVARKVVLTNDPVSDTDARVVEVRIQIDSDCISRVERLSNARVLVMVDTSE
jgi:HlyD family secretion protein